jgi:hypothetical protein
MALPLPGGEWYTAFSFTENGVVTNRRIHRMEIQAKDGYLYVLEGKDMPDALHVNTGQGHKGKHLATILLNRKNSPPRPRGKVESWPSPRDALNVLLGLAFSVLLFRVVAKLAEVSW